MSAFDDHAAQLFREALKSADDRISNEIGELAGRRVLGLLQAIEKELNPAQQRAFWVALVEELALPRWMTD